MGELSLTMNEYERKKKAPREKQIWKGADTLEELCRDFLHPIRIKARVLKHELTEDCLCIDLDGPERKEILYFLADELCDKIEALTGIWDDLTQELIKKEKMA